MTTRMWNEEQSQAETVSRLTDLKRTVDMAINVTETGPLFPCDQQWKVELEPDGMIIGDWYCTKIKKYEHQGNIP